MLLFLYNILINILNAQLNYIFYLTNFNIIWSYLSPPLAQIVGTNLLGKFLQFWKLSKTIANWKSKGKCGNVKKLNNSFGASNVSRKYSWSQTTDTTCRNAPNSRQLSCLGIVLSPFFPLSRLSLLPLFVCLFFWFLFFSLRFWVQLFNSVKPDTWNGARAQCQSRQLLGGPHTHTDSHTHSQRILNFNYQKIVFMCDLLQSVGCAKLLNVLPQSLLLLLLLWLLFLQLLLL